jgi:hypothetical protein
MAKNLERAHRRERIEKADKLGKSSFALCSRQPATCKHFVPCETGAALCSIE